MTVRDPFRSVPARVYEVDDAHRDALARDLADDSISRLSLYIRDAEHFGVEKRVVYVALEGEEERLRQADERILLYARRPEEAERILEWLRWEDEATAVGIGTIFGAVDPPTRARAAPLTPFERGVAAIGRGLRRFWAWLKR
jgi:hypothetical protein